MPRNPRFSDMAYSFGPGPMTPAVRILLYINIGAYVVTLFFPAIFDWFGLQPQDVIEKYRLWQPVTYMFFHVQWPTHILFNMLILWMFGVDLERTWGTPFFVKYYFVTGVGAGLVSIAACYLPFRAMHLLYGANIIGASGALFGLLIAYAIYYPNRPILMFLLFPVPAKYFVAILGAINLIMTANVGGVSATTHLGGLAIGYIYLQSGRGGITAEIKYRYLKWRMNRLRRKFDVYSGGRSEKSNWDRHVH
jgi:membrane associated rhomboid family serine protease